MKIPSKPPDTDSVSIEKIRPVFQNINRADVARMMQKNLEQYPFWDKLRHWPMPKGITPEMAWVSREWMAMGKRQTVADLVDTKGKAFTYWLPDKALEWLHLIDRNATGQLLSESGPLSPGMRDRYIVSSLMEEAIASSQIEGAATTRKAAKEMLRTGRKPKDKSERMILNNYLAMDRIRKLCRSELTLDSTHELHTILTEETLKNPEDAGRLRASPQDDDISVIDVDGTVLHHPPAGKELPARLEKFFAFANNEQPGKFIHPVIKAILLHFWIGHDHPYVDGNGRTARAIFYWYLLRKDYWLFEFISISRIVLKAAGQYKRAFLYSELGPNDTTYFIMFNLKAIHLAIEEVKSYIARKQMEIQQSTHLLRQLPGLNGRQRELLVDALRHPGRQYTIAKHKSTHQVSYQTARVDLFDLADKGLLDQAKDGRTYIFIPSKKSQSIFERLSIPIE